jgi:hypothetical protein|tara:strand:+ start:40 stop:660 length:621 start_codon:yes stop_codon:yes gene_type:complete
VKKFQNFKIKELKKISNQQFSEIIKLITNENPESILACLNKETIKDYLNKVAISKDVLIYVIQNKDKIIAYAIIAKNIEKLTSIFLDKKITILFSLIINFKFIKLINIILSYVKLDIIFLKKKYKNIIYLNYNLNLLAVGKKFQSKGLGSYFLRKIFKNFEKSKYITVETIDEKATKFYQKKHNFKIIGKKLRFPKNLKVLYKKIT